MIVVIAILLQIICTGLVYLVTRKQIASGLKRIERREARREAAAKRLEAHVLRLLDTHLEHIDEIAAVAGDAKNDAAAAVKAANSMSARFDRGEKPAPGMPLSVEQYQRRGNDREIRKINEAKAIVRGQENEQ